MRKYYLVDNSIAYLTIPLEIKYLCPDEVKDEQERGHNVFLLQKVGK